MVKVDIQVPDGSVYAIFYLQGYSQLDFTRLHVYYKHCILVLECPLYRRHPYSFKHKAKWYVRKQWAILLEDSQDKYVVKFTFPKSELDTRKAKFKF